ncbi:MAG: ATP-grasp domain-containing protein [Planctomycetia bacterium]|nr:ATP-grasp domain-containing protein [Planctomycetia bacterium]
MIDIFVFEFTSGGGLLCGGPPGGSLLVEGTAMLAALAGDFAAIDGVAVHVLRDRRLPELTFPPRCQVVEVDDAAQEQRTFRDLAARCDWTVVIAPEISGELLKRCRAVEECGRLLGPPSALVELASDKHATAMFLQAQGIRLPTGLRLAPGDQLPAGFSYPAVLKPLDGAGSQGIRTLAGPEVGFVVDRPSRLEKFCRGLPASVAVLCGPGGHFVLLPCKQHISTDGACRWLGGRLPLSDDLQSRAVRLAESVTAAIYRAELAPLGYFGIDVVLGDSADDDVVVEVNPRLTTSYVGLRAAARQYDPRGAVRPGNLAEAMLRLANGQEAALWFDCEPLEFDASGRAWRLQHRL